METRYDLFSLVIWKEGRLKFHFPFLNLIIKAGSGKFAVWVPPNWPSLIPSGTPKVKARLFSYRQKKSRSWEDSNWSKIGPKVQGQVVTPSLSESAEFLLFSIVPRWSSLDSSLKKWLHQASHFLKHLCFTFTHIHSLNACSSRKQSQKQVEAGIGWCFQML